MTTKHHPTQRKHKRNATRRRHALKTRMKTSRPLRALIQPQRQERKQGDASVLLSPVDSMLHNAAVCCNGMNLVRSAVNDEDGSYLVMSIEVPLPFTAAYDAWTRFDDVPHFMRGAHLSEAHDGSRMTWRIQTLFDQFAWQGKVCEQEPFEFIAWASVQGAPHPGFGSVSFEPISHRRTWILVQVGFDMRGVYRWLGDPVPWLSHSLEQSLKRFHNSTAAQLVDGEEFQAEPLAEAVP